MSVTEIVRQAMLRKLGMRSWPRGKAVSLRDIARVSGVSVSTVSRFMNEKTIQADALDKLAEWADLTVPLQEPDRYRILRQQDSFLEVLQVMQVQRWCNEVTITVES